MGPTKLCVKRLQKEFREVEKNPVSFLKARPREDNILEWHFVVHGLDGDYTNGIYHGILTFPEEYPYKPPSMTMLTPSGRFHTNKKLCLSFTDFHPESWQPAWNVHTMLAGFVSFFTDSNDAATFGSLSATSAQRKQFAMASLMFNMNDKQFLTLFPDMVKLSYKIQDELTGRESAGFPNLVEGKVDGDGRNGSNPATSNKKFIDSVFLVFFAVFFSGFVGVLFFLFQQR